MAEPKKQFQLERLSSSSKTIVMHAINLDEAVEIAKSVKGVVSVTKFSATQTSLVHISPLYDIDEIMLELEGLLSPVPEVFNEVFKEGQDEC